MYVYSIYIVSCSFMITQLNFQLGNRSATKNIWWFNLITNTLTFDKWIQFTNGERTAYLSGAAKFNLVL